MGNFNMIPPDQVIEQTINKDQKGPGGIIGFSTSPGCVQRWVLSSHDTASIIADFELATKKITNASKPKDLQESRIKYDEEMVSKCYRTISGWLNPFTENNNLISLSSGIKASTEVQIDLLGAKDVGEKCLQRFIEERVETQTVDFHTKITKNKLKTFNDEINVKVVKTRNQNILLKSDRQTFARMMVIQQHRQLEIKHVLSFELSAVPVSLSNLDSTLRKSVKSKLFESLQHEISQEPPDQPCPLIHDAMVMLQKLPPVLTTFGSISDYILKKSLDG